MKVLKFDKDVIAALKKLGSEVAEDIESAQRSCCVDIVHPASSAKFLAQSDRD